MAQHDLVTHPLTVRRLEVSRARDVNPRMRRVTLVGPELDAFSRDGFDLPAFASDTFDDHVKLVFAADGDIAAALPVQRARSIDWPPSEHRQGRDYTPRRWDPVRRELDLDFVLHGDGPAVRWATAAQPGDHLHVVGPKSSLVLPDDIDWILLAGDETALPAIGRFLDERPLPVPVQIVLELRDQAARQELPSETGTAWSGSSRHLRRPRHSPPPSSDCRGGRENRTPGWRGESIAAALRRWLRRDRGLEPSHVNVTGYWHAEEDEGSADRSATVDTETLLSPLPWLATKAAIELGLLDRIGEKATTSSSLANQVGVEVGALRPLLAYLAGVRVLLAADDAYALGPIAEELLGDDHLQDELFGVEARGMEALSQLAPALRSGSAPWQLANGTSLAGAVENTPELYAQRTEAAGAFAFVAGGVPDLPVWRAVERLTVTGPGAIALLAAAHNRGLWPMDVIICAPPVALDVLRRQGRNLPLRYAAGPDDVPGSDLVISTLEVDFRTDEELVAQLRELARHANRALVIDALEHTGPGSPGGAAERELIDLGGIGRGPRDADELIRLAAVAGWQLKEQVKLGWDFEVFDLVR